MWNSFVEFLDYVVSLGLGTPVGHSLKYVGDLLDSHLSFLLGTERSPSFDYVVLFLSINSWADMGFHATDSRIFDFYGYMTPLVQGSQYVNSLKDLLALDTISLESDKYRLYYYYIYLDMKNCEFFLCLSGITKKILFESIEIHSNVLINNANSHENIKILSSDFSRHLEDASKDFVLTISNHTDVGYPASIYGIARNLEVHYSFIEFLADCALGALELNFFDS